MSAFGDVVQDVRAILRSPRRPANKFVTYFNLLDAFRMPGCPVCALLEEGERKALDALLYEQVNDPATRERLVASHGFCNWHAWMLPSVATSASGVALIYRHLLNETLERVTESLREARPRSRWQRIKARLFGTREEPVPLLAWRKRKQRCYLCTSSRRMERRYLQTLLEFLGEAAFAETFGRPAGLCLPHLCLAATFCRDHPNLRSLLAAQETCWRDLMGELDEFIRKFDYRYANEARGREGGSWSRALEALVGRRAVFGPERWGDVVERDAVAPLAEMPHAPETAALGTVGEIDHLRFENARLRRQVEELLTQAPGRGPETAEETLPNKAHGAGPTC